MNAQQIMKTLSALGAGFRIDEVGDVVFTFPTCVFPDDFLMQVLKEDIRANLDELRAMWAVPTDEIETIYAEWRADTAPDEAAYVERCKKAAGRVGLTFYF
jgi:hypothetical protein